MGFEIMNMRDMVLEMSKEEILGAVFQFVCPYNRDVECFLREKAYEFSVQGLASTHLVYASYKEEYVLVGYFTLAQKHFHVNLKGNRGLNSKLRHRLSRFAEYDSELKKSIVAAPLIGQLGKNYANGYNELITGAELLEIACETVAEAQRLLGGKIVYLECEDVPALRNFYNRAGFMEFGKRDLDGDEMDSFSSRYLIQMLKYLE